jgi:hypothetical protein
MSAPHILSEEFSLWQRNADLQKKFQSYAIERILEIEGTISIDTFFGVGDPSPNVVMRMKGEGCAYKLALQILAARNVSVMPVECFSPPCDWPRDLRVTVAVAPHKLISGFTHIVQHLDNIFAWENKQDWLSPGSQILLEKVGLCKLSDVYDHCGKSYKTNVALKKIFSVMDSTPSHLLGASSSLLILGHMWQELEEDIFPKKWAELTDSIVPEELTSDRNENSIALELIKAEGRWSPNVCNMPREIKSLLNEYFQWKVGIIEEESDNCALLEFARYLGEIPFAEYEKAKSLSELFESLPNSNFDKAKIDKAIRKDVLSQGQVRLNGLWLYGATPKLGMESQG